MRPGDTYLVSFHFYDGPEARSHFEEAKGKIDKINYGPSGELESINVSRIEDGYRNSIPVVQINKRLKK